MEQRIGRLETNLREAALAIARLDHKIDHVAADLKQQMSDGFSAVMNSLDSFSRDVEASRRERRGKKQ